MRIALLAVGAVALVAAACQPAAPAASPSGVAPPAGSPSAAPARAENPEIQRLLAAARDAGETELNVTWSTGSLGGHEGAAKYEALFNRMYGTNIKINFTPGPSMPDMHAKVIQEQAAGLKASTAIVLGAESDLAGIFPRDALEPYDYTLLSPRIIPEVVAMGNIAVETNSTIPAVLYNTELVRGADVPVNLEDVLDPKWKSKIAGSQTMGSLSRVAMRPEWGPERMKAFVSRLSQQVGGVIRNSEENRIVSGEFVMYVMGNTHGARDVQRKGAPIGYVIPPDGATAGFQHMGVPRNSAQPNLAKLLINVVMSEEGQRILWEVAATDHHALPGSQSGAEIAELKAKGSGIFDVDVQAVYERPEMNKLRVELDRMLSGMR
jgi:ABC-type Fe3+ transport system substrate-binding protein